MQTQHFLRFLGKLFIWFLVSQAPGGWAEQRTGFYVYFEKPDSWNQVYMYSWTVKDGKIQPSSGPWPGRALADVAGWYRSFIDASQLEPLSGEIKIIFNNAAGEQTPDLTRTGQAWYVWKRQGKIVNQWFDQNPKEQLFQASIKGGRGTGRYSPGSLVSIQANTPTDALFSGWQGQDFALLADPKQVSTQFQMPAHDVSISAGFEDFSSGRAQYRQLCAKCHGQAGEGGLGPSLVLATGSCQTCGDDASLQKRISSTMPVGAVGTCTGDCAKSTARFIRYALNKGNAQDCTQLASRMGQRQLRLLTQKEYHNTIRDLFGLEVLKAERFWPEAANVLGYNNNAEAALVTDRHLRVFVVLAHEISEQILPADRYRMVCQGDQRCTIAKLGLEVFRRPLAEAEISTYLKLWLENQGSSRTVLEAMLLSPRFLYRSELGSFVSPMGAYKLDSYELASAMSYTLVGTTPDQTLLDQAAKGNLLNASIRRQEAERLLESEAARQSFGDFALQWLGIGGLATLTRDNPLLNSRIRADMIKETQLFLTQLVFDKNADLGALFRAEETPLSSELARYYGLAPPAAEWQPVAYDESRRGLLAQGSLLASYANSGEASPIKRGVFIRNRLLCQNLPQPPANVDTKIPAPVPGLNIRERLKQHLAQGQQSNGENSCASCHQYIDKLGFSLENFDELARFRSVYKETPRIPIDTSGELKGPTALGDGETLAFNSLRDLSEILGASRQLKECAALQYLRYARAYQESSEDRCSRYEITENLKNDGSFRSFLVEFIASDGFMWRK